MSANGLSESRTPEQEASCGKNKSQTREDAELQSKGADGTGGSGTLALQFSILSGLAFIFATRSFLLWSP